MTIISVQVTFIVRFRVHNGTGRDGMRSIDQRARHRSGFASSTWKDSSQSKPNSSWSAAVRPFILGRPFSFSLVVFCDTRKPQRKRRRPPVDRFVRGWTNLSPSAATPRFQSWLPWICIYNALSMFLSHTLLIHTTNHDQIWRRMGAQRLHQRAVYGLVWFVNTQWSTF